MTLTQLTIDLDAVAANYRLLAARAAPARTAAAVKADAYGLGLEPVARALADAGCETFFVATLDEGLALRGMLPRVEIFVLNGLIAGDPALFKESRLAPVLNDLGQIEAWAEFCRRAGTLPAAVHLDTGMARLGLPPAELDVLAAEPGRLEGVELRCLMSHLACAEEAEHPLNRQQLDDFTAAIDRIAIDRALDQSRESARHVKDRIAIDRALDQSRESARHVKDRIAIDRALDQSRESARHVKAGADQSGSGPARLQPAAVSLANSSGIFLGADWHFDMVRPGAALYGLNPRPGGPNPMAPVVQLQAKILQIRDVDTPQTVGYGATHRVSGPARIATVAAGYADGYPRSLSGCGSARIGDVALPVVGRVSMDLTTLDVTNIPEARPGDMVDLIGPHNDVDALAAQAGMIGYEILTSLGQRYRRSYIHGGGGAA